MISPAEFQEAQAALLGKQYPLQQTESALLANEASHMAKVKELADLDNRIAEEKSRFMQALNSLISDGEQWTRQYVLMARQAGTVSYAGTPSKSNLSYMNARRDHQLFRDLYLRLLDELWQKQSHLRPELRRLKRKVLLMDATVIPLCLSWLHAFFRTHYGRKNS